ARHRPLESLPGAGIALAAQGPGMPFATSADARIHYDSQGDGAPILLVPGLGGSTRQLERIAATLATTHRVISVDPRGGGQSDKPDAVYTGEALAQDMVSVLDHA